MKQIFEGTGVALVTPFDNDKIDYKSTKELIERGLQKGVKAFIVLATTGEGCVISDKEREKFIKVCLKANAGRAKVIVGTGNNNFEKCYNYTLQAKQLGADGALVVTPYYNKTTQKGLVEFYKELEKIKLPIIVYNVPSRTGLVVELETIKELLKDNQFIFGIKESTTDISRIKKLCAICRGKIPVYSGEDDLNYIFYCLGGKGCISVTANVYPDKVEEVYRLAKQGDYSRSLECQEKLDEVNHALFLETNPIPIKYYMSLMGLISDKTRRPLTDLTEDNKTKLQNLYKKLELKQKV